MTNKGWLGICIVAIIGFVLGWYLTDLVRMFGKV